MTFIIEGESPRKAGNEEDESFGVYGGKITEAEKLQRDVVMKKGSFVSLPAQNEGRRVSMLTLLSFPVRSSCRLRSSKITIFPNSRPS